MTAPAERVARHVEALLRGRRPRRVDASPDEAAAISAASRFVVGGEEADPEFIERLHERLRRELDPVPAPAPRLSRRAVLAAAGALAAAAAGAAAGRALLPAPAPAGGRLVANGATWRFAANLAQMPEGVAVPFATDSMLVLLIRRGEAVSALTGTCTHLGCRLRADAGAIACPCHRTRFALDGQVLEHELPAAPPALPEVPVRVVQGRVEVLAV